MDKRRFRRLDARLIVRIRSHRPTAETLRQAELMTENVSLGGVFIQCPQPFSIGTAVEIDLNLPGQKQPLHARGLVRWVSTQVAPLGMGVELIEVSTASKTEIRRFVADQIAQKGLASITGTTVHKELLRFYGSHIGESFPIADLAKQHTIAEETLTAVLGDFTQAGLATVAGDAATFQPCPDAERKELIEDWLAHQDGGSLAEEAAGTAHRVATPAGSEASRAAAPMNPPPGAAPAGEKPPEADAGPAPKEKPAVEKKNS